jgi:hypothetical protein
MGRIYRNCSQVRIWLGCDAPECNLEHKAGNDPGDPFELLRRFGANEHACEWPGFAARSEVDGTYTIRDGNALELLWEKHLRVANSAWWTRVWTVQEILLPPTGKLTYDTWSISLEELLECGTWPTSHLDLECCNSAIHSLARRFGADLITQLGGYLQLHIQRRPRADCGDADFYGYHLLSGHRQCHDPRDKIYGLLGIMDKSGGILPDYSASLASVFYQGTCSMMDYIYLGGFRCLTGPYYGPSGHKWASWVREFDVAWPQMVLQTSLSHILAVGLFDASGNTSSRYERCYSYPCLSDEKSYQIALAVTGQCVGKIMTICQARCPNLADITHHSLIFKAWMEAAEFDFEANPAIGQHAITNKKFWRTVLGGTLSDSYESDNFELRRFAPEDMDLLDIFVAWIQYGHVTLPTSITKLVKTIVSTLRVSTLVRTYFRTHSEGHGLCYPHCEVGDEVWVLDGANVPFVLRYVHIDTAVEENILRPSEAYVLDDKTGFPIGTKEGSVPRAKPAGHYQLIGDCYLDGFMDGEGLDDDKYPSQSIMLV